MGNAEDVSEVHISSIFRNELSGLLDMGGNMYLKNVGNTAHINTVQRCERKINDIIKPKLF
jgi:hypothetical protein